MFFGNIVGNIPRYVFGLHPIHNELDVVITSHALHDNEVPIVYKPVCSLGSPHSVCVDVQLQTAKAHKFSSGPGKLFSHNLTSDSDSEPSKRLKNGLTGKFPRDLGHHQTFGPIL